MVCLTCYVVFFNRINKHYDKYGKNRDVRVVFLGDYIDRGPDSFSVLETIRMIRNRDVVGLMPAFRPLVKDGVGFTFLRGNHEEMMIHARYVFSYNEMWMKHGGRECLASYHNNSSSVIRSHRTMLEKFSYDL